MSAGGAEVASPAGLAGIGTEELEFSADGEGLVEGH